MELHGRNGGPNLVSIFFLLQSAMKKILQILKLVLYTAGMSDCLFDVFSCIKQGRGGVPYTRVVVQKKSNYDVNIMSNKACFL